MVGAATEAVALLGGVFAATALLPSPPSKTSHFPVIAASRALTSLPVEVAAAVELVVVEMMVAELGCFQWNLKLKVLCWFLLPLLVLHLEQNLISLLVVEVAGVWLFPIPAFGTSLGIHFSP